MSDKIVLRRLRGGSLFKLLFVGNLGFFVPFSLLVGVLTLFDAATVTWNKQPVTGPSGLLLSPFVGLFMSLLASVFSWLTTFIGLWVFSRFKPMELEYIPIADEET